jgi:Bacterial regulatory proteins, luxR family
MWLEIGIGAKAGIILKFRRAVSADGARARGHTPLEGMTNRDIAQALHVTEHTVSNYLYRIFDRLGISSRVQLILHVLSNNQSVSSRPPESNWDQAGSKKTA